MEHFSTCQLELQLNSILTTDDIKDTEVKFEVEVDEKKSEVFFRK